MIALLSLKSDLLRLDINNCGAIYAKGLCHYFQVTSNFYTMCVVYVLVYNQDDTAKAHLLFQKVLKVDPDHSKARAAFKVEKDIN